MAKRIHGRRRHLLVDTLRLVLGVLLTAAKVPACEGGRNLRGRVLDCFTCLRRKSGADAWSRPKLERPAEDSRPDAQVDAITRSNDIRPFKACYGRWVAESTSGWLMRRRRLARDHKQAESSAEAWINIAMIRTQLRRLA